jgi:hypothetical protein
VINVSGMEKTALGAGGGKWVRKIRSEIGKIGFRP